MAIDNLGDWVDFGQLSIPHLQDGRWISVDGINDLPSNVARLRFGDYQKSKVQNFLRLRATIFTDTLVIQTPSSKVYPAPKEEKIIKLSIPEEILRVDGWGVSFEVMKCWAYRGPRKTADLISYTIDFSSLKQTLEQRTSALSQDLNRIERKIDVLVN